MKTIRDYINLIESNQQVDEMDRRDFLKGAGALAAAGAVSAGAYMNRGKSNFEGNDGVYIDQILRLYVVSKELSQPPNNRPGAAETYTKCKELIGKFLSSNPKMKPVINSEYQLVVKGLNDEAATDYKKYHDTTEYLFSNRNRLIRDFEEFLSGKDPQFGKPKDEFDEGLSETSDEAIARIEVLAKN